MATSGAGGRAGCGRSSIPPWSRRRVSRRDASPSLVPPLSTVRVSRPPKAGKHEGWMCTSKPMAKRHIVVDVLGLLLTVVVHSAGMPDGTGGKLVVRQLFTQIKR